MKIKAIISVVMAVCVTVSAPGFARGNDHQNDRGRQEHSQRGHQADRHDKHDRHGKKDKRDKHYKYDRHDRYDNQVRVYDYRRDNSRGAGPRHDMRKGNYLSHEYRDQRYVVNDWRGRHLNAPPQGYHWVQTGNDYVLVAIATGIIVHLLLNN
ncbi:MAG: RcnB family protein [Burkholderiaceae bacterium]